MVGSVTSHDWKDSQRNNYYNGMFCMNYAKVVVWAELDSALAFGYYLHSPSGCALSSGCALCDPSLTTILV